MLPAEEQDDHRAQSEEDIELKEETAVGVAAQAEARQEATTGTCVAAQKLPGPGQGVAVAGDQQEERQECWWRGRGNCYVRRRSTTVVVEKPGKYKRLTAQFGAPPHHWAWERVAVVRRIERVDVDDFIVAVVWG